MIRDITIRPVLNGFVVTVGCQILTFNDVNTLCVELGNYLSESEETEKRYRRTAINRYLLDAPQPTAAPPPGICGRDQAPTPTCDSDRTLSQLGQCERRGP